MVSTLLYTMAVMWLCQLPSRLLFFVRTRRLVRVIVLVFLVVFYCEFLHYYVVLLCCFWPILGRGAAVSGPYYSRPLRIMLIGDTHLLGAGAHWFDKLRREWQMTRSFQASMLIHSPDIVFVLGDLLDEAKHSSNEEFEKDADRFKKMFKTPIGVQTEIVVGNHDIGFHYMMNDRKHDRFVKKFDAPSVQLLHIRGVIFVLINSIAMEGDTCNICRDTVDKLKDIKWKLKCSKAQSEQQYPAKVCETMETFAYTKPILLQHFPLFRDSDVNCSTPDAAPDGEREIPFKEKFDCLSRESTDMAEVNGDDFVVKRCYLPSERTVISIYISGAFLLVLCICLPTCGRKSTGNKELIFVNKSH